MKQLAAAILIAFLSLMSYSCRNCPADPQNDSALNGTQKIELPPKCMEYHSEWRGRGTIRELIILEDMSDNEIKEFLKDYQAEP